MTRRLGLAEWVQVPPPVCAWALPCAPSPTLETALYAKAPSDLGRRALERATRIELA